MEKIQNYWVESFLTLIGLCKIKTNESIIVLTETRSRELNVIILEQAIKKIGLEFIKIEIPSKPYLIDPIVKSTGASNILDGNDVYIKKLKESDIIFDLTKEGLMHSKQTKEILSSGTRIMNISDEHPEILSRLKPDLHLKNRVKEAVLKCRNSSIMKVISDAGTNLEVNMKKTNTVGVWGWTDKPGTLAHWPGGLVVSFPNTSCVNGKLVFQTGDINLTFKKYFDTEVTFDIENDFVKTISGKGTDKKLIEKYFKSFNDKNSYATSHVGWGLNNKSRYEALTMYDKSELNGTELRALSGCFLYSTGANEFANRYADGHFDLPMMDCTISLDDEIVVKKGQVI
jgi:2,5-dihydroxypyridine 5,6-dioxygenase